MVVTTEIDDHLYLGRCDWYDGKVVLSITKAMSPMFHPQCYYYPPNYKTNHKVSNQNPRLGLRNNYVDVEEVFPRGNTMRNSIT